MDDILEYCSMTWGVTFPVFDKVRVNGKKAAPLYKELTRAEDVDGKAGPGRVELREVPRAARWPGQAVPSADEAR